MQRTILLNEKVFPERYKKIKNLSIKGKALNTFIENLIIFKLNEVNNKLNVHKVEYVDFKQLPFSSFPSEVSENIGLIIEDVNISKKQYQKFNKNKEGYVYINQGSYYYRKIKAYLYFTQAEIKSRNIAIAQIIFPAILELMGEFINSPMYSIMNHPAYCINLYNDSITADSIKRQIYGLNSLGIKYIDLFAKYNEYSTFHLNTFDNYIDKVYERELVNPIDENYIKIDIKNKKVTLKYPNDITTFNKSQNIDFKGSYEKFYLMTILPITILAIKEKYIVDLKELQSFIVDYNKNNKSNSKKIKRFESQVQTPV